jgi:transposase
MTKYNKEFKESIIKQMFPPQNKSVNQIMKETGVNEQTLYSWKKKTKESRNISTDNRVPGSKWTSEEKFAAVIETISMNEVEIASYCRSKGIYAEELKVWKEACTSANDKLLESTAGFKKEIKEKDKELKQISIELRRKEKALAEAAALLILKKKAQSIWGDNEEE